LGLTRFKASLARTGVGCTWTTEDEKGLSRFILERSTDGFQFKPVHTRKAEGSSKTNHYQFLDEEALRLGVTFLYYRLKLVEDGGWIRYSQTEQVNLGARALEEMRVYPVPFEKQLEIELVLPADDEVRFQVCDVLGREVWNENVRMDRGPAIHSLNLEALPNGTYFLKVQTSGLVETRKIVRQ
jgi:hypothetical protein